MQTTSVIDTARAADIAADTLLARQHGFVFREPAWFADGTRLWDIGAKAFRAQRLAFEEMPLARVVMNGVIDRVRAEDRHDYTVPVGSLRMRYDGRLYNHNAALQKLALTDWSYAQLLARAGAPAAAGSYLPTLPTEIAADAANYHLIKADIGPDGKPIAEGNRRRVMLRTRRDEAGGRMVYAALGARYERHDVNQVAEALAAAVPSHAKGKFITDGARWELMVSFGSPIEPCVGEVFNAWISVRGADDGSRGIRINSVLERVRCRNLTRQTASITVDKLAHKGKLLAKKVRDALDTAYQSVAKFAERWADAAKTQVLSQGFDLGVEQVMQILVDQGLVTRPTGVDAADFVAQLVAAYYEEPGLGLTQQGLNCAITRAAQQYAPWAAETMEEEAGELLYNYVCVTPAMAQASGIEID